MKTLTASQARKDIYNLLDLVSREHAPVTITGKRSNGVLISEEDWLSIKETLYLMSIKGIPESIRKGMDEDIDKCSKDLDW